METQNGVATCRFGCRTVDEWRPFLWFRRGLRGPGHRPNQAPERPPKRIAWLNKFSPPPGKLIKIVAKALSDEHVFNLKFGRATKSGEPVRASGGYTLNPEGQPHSAFIGSESISLVIYRGEPDEIVSLEVVDIAA